MADFIGITRKTFKKLLNEATFDTGEVWDQVPERNRGGGFLYRGNESKKIKKRSEEEVWVSIMKRTPRTT